MFGVFGVALCALAATTETFDYEGKYKHVCGHLDSLHLVSPARICVCLSLPCLIGFRFIKGIILLLFCTWDPIVVLAKEIIRVWALISQTGDRCIELQYGATGGQCVFTGTLPCGFHASYALIDRFTSPLVSMKFCRFHK